MSTALEHLLLQLHRKDIRIWIAEDRLRVDAPKGTLTDELKAELRERKSDLLQFLKSAQGTDTPALPPLKRVARGQPLPLSFGQQRLWFLHQINPQSDAYDIQFALFFETEADILRSALSTFVARHEIWRTTYALHAGNPVQIIHPPRQEAYPVVDLSHLPADKLPHETRRLASSEREKRFDLSKGPVWRSVIVKLEKGIVALLLTLHHIVTDAKTPEIVSKELLQLCHAIKTGSSPQLPELTVQYADYAYWQHQYMQGPIFNHHFDFWKDKLTDVPTLQLPFDRPRPAVQRFKGDYEVRTLPGGLVDQLKNMCRRMGVTLFMMLFTAFVLLLHRHTRQEDIAVGSPFSNRNLAELEHLVGFFVNMLVFRVDLSGDPDFRRLLSRVREVALEAFRHNDLPFEILVKELEPDRDLSRNPLFQVVFALDRIPHNAGELEHRDPHKLFATSMNTTRFDLEAHVMETSEGCDVAFNYNVDLFEADTIRRMLEHFVVLLEEIVANPGQSVADLNLIRSFEYEKMLFRWNQTEAEYPATQPVHALFEDQAGREPDAPAVIQGRECLSYGQLDQRSDHLANYLSHVGVGPEVVVGVCLQRSLDLVTAILGILKTGGAYLPMDPTYPDQRLDYMLADAAAPVLLTQESLHEKFPQYRGRIIRLDSNHWKKEARTCSGAVPKAEWHAGHLAYVIYTSGSTGNPKGVGITHNGLLNLVSWHRRTYNLTPEDRASHLAGLGFDASVWELWPYLVSGSSIYLADEEVLSSTARLWSWIAENRITVSFFPTPLAEAALGERPVKGLALRALLTGGDRLHGSEHADLPFDYVNHYGPTENTVVSTSATIGSNASGNNPPPIGRPIFNVTAYVLDHRICPVPIGVAGELYVGGAGLARGYLNRPRLTAERFVPDPFSGTPGSRLYRTGDLVKYNTDGNIAFLGRRDEQVKIRGFRIEIGEVEAQLTHHPSVNESVVVCRPSPTGTKQLIAYVAGEKTNLSAQDLGAFLRNKLPGYMVPAAFVFLDSLPLTANGKIDRKALPEPQADRQKDGGFVAPRTQQQKALASIWEILLKVDRVGLQDNFFDLGGHSLILMQIISAFEAETGIRLNPLDFFHQNLGQIVAPSDPDNDEYGDLKTAAPAAQPIEPFYFGPQDRQLFGFYHLSTSGSPHGVILCHPHAHEYIRCFRAIRELSKRLVNAGCHVLTFDFYGSGDSMGRLEDGEIAGWQSDLACAIDETKKRFALERVGLVGLRLGASMAASAALDRKDINALVLWEPVVSGKKLIREMLAIKSPVPGVGQAHRLNAELFDVCGHPLTADMMTDLEQLDLTTMPPPAVENLLVLGNGSDDGDARFDALVTGWGLDPAYRRISEARIWRHEPYEAIVPHYTLQSIVDWISEVYR